jgi:hypothetical protein
LRDGRLHSALRQTGEAFRRGSMLWLQRKAAPEVPLCPSPLVLDQRDVAEMKQRTGTEVCVSP